VLAAILAFGLAATLARSPRRADVVVRGYPYAWRCPKAGYKDVVDRWGMDMCNCTSYVAWALDANGQRTDWFIRGAMDAWNWPHVARLGRIPVGRRPRLGSVAVWPRIARPFGHVAYVTRVEEDGGIDVAEYNLPLGEGGKSYLFDIRRDIRPTGVVFIYPPARSSR
jgi:surface antigen